MIWCGRMEALFCADERKTLMSKPKIGNSGLECAPLVLGTNVFGWNVEEPAAERLYETVSTVYAASAAEELLAQAETQARSSSQRLRA